MNELDQILSQQDFSVSLDAPMGSQLLIQIAGVEGSLRSQLIGCRPGQYVLIAPPRRTGISQKIFEGNQILVRYVSHGTMCSFQSNIIGAVTTPFSMMFLSYPVLMERRALREEQRKACWASVVVGCNDDQWPAEICDFSRSGCCLTNNLSAGPNPGKIRLGTKVDVLIKGDDEAPDRKFSAEVRNIGSEGKRLFMGLRYTEKEAELIGRVQADLISLPAKKGRPPQKNKRKSILSG